VLPQVLAFFKSAGLEKEIPLIVAGGLSSVDDIRRMQALGASAVQLGTAFAVTEECDADEHFKHVLAQAQPQDMVEFISVAGCRPAPCARPGWTSTCASNPSSRPWPM
jgi:nitronate monooxygenase